MIKRSSLKFTARNYDLNICKTQYIFNVSSYLFKIFRLSYTGIKEETADETESEFVEVPIELKGHVIGRGGCMLQEIMRQSGAIISSQSKEEKGFLVNGDKEQRAYAKKKKKKKVVSNKYKLFP